MTEKEARGKQTDRQTDKQAGRRIEAGFGTDNGEGEEKEEEE